MAIIFQETHTIFEIMTQKKLKLDQKMSNEMDFQEIHIHLGRKQVPKYVGELGERCIQNVIKILCYFKPKNYYIENPASSLIWKYIKYNLGFTNGIKTLLIILHIMKIFQKNQHAFYQILN